MIYLDNGATSMNKPPEVGRAMGRALACCANPGRGGYRASMEAAETVYRCRETAGKLFSCPPEQVVFTSNCTHGLNMAIRTLVKPGARVVISGFEHNAVTRPLHALGAEIQVAGRHLFGWAETQDDLEGKLKKGVDAAVFTHVSNVFGYILPVEELASLCRRYGVPFVVDAAQSAGMLPVNLEKWGADFIAMPGHKGLLGPQGTGLLLCGRMPEALLLGQAARAAGNAGFPPRPGRGGNAECAGHRGAGRRDALGDPHGGAAYLCPADPAAAALCRGTTEAGLSGICRGTSGRDGILPAQNGLPDGGGLLRKKGNRPAGRAALRAPGSRKRGYAGNRNPAGQLRA